MSLSDRNMAMNLSFAGCGFLGIYHAGVASCFKEYAPGILVNKISGASAGSIAACCLICDCSIGQITSDVLKIATTARKYTFGPFSPSFNVLSILRDRLTNLLPDDAHVRCTNRLHVSVTRVSDGQNVILSQFASKAELVQAVLCSSFIPIFCGYIPEKFRGVRYIDGGYSNNLPILDENTVTVSPFCGESDICPRDNSYNLFQLNVANTSIELSPQNLYRIMRILFPPHPEILSEMCRQGFDDALRFLQRNNLISCTRCIQVSSTLKMKDSNELSDSEEELLEDEFDEEEEEECDDCHRRREEAASVDELPEAVLAVLEEATLAMNNGFVNWVFKHKSMRLLSVLTLPYVLPIDIAQAAFNKFKELVPKLGNDLNALAEWIISYLKNVIYTFNKQRHLYSAKFSCQLAITEYDFASEDKPPPSPSRSPTPRRNSCMPMCSRRSSIRPRSGDWSGAGARRERKTSAGSRLMSSVNFGFTVDLANMPPALQSCSESASKNPQLSKALNADKMEASVVDLTNRALSLNPAEVLGRASNEQYADAFEQVLEVTQQQDAVMAYYYLDENNKVRVTSIFDATDPDKGAALPPEEFEVNRGLTWEDDEFEEDDGLMLPPPRRASSCSQFLSTSASIEYDDSVYDDDEDEGEYIPSISVDSMNASSYLSLGNVLDDVAAEDQSGDGEIV